MAERTDVKNLFMANASPAPPKAVELGFKVLLAICADHMQTLVDQCDSWKELTEDDKAEVGFALAIVFRRQQANLARVVGGAACGTVCDGPPEADWSSQETHWAAGGPPVHARGISGGAGRRGAVSGAAIS